MRGRRNYFRVRNPRVNLGLASALTDSLGLLQEPKFDM